MSITKIAKSFSRKLNLKRYGIEYETADFFCEAEANIEDGSNVAIAAKELHEFVTQEVADDIAAFDEQMQKKK